MLKSYGGWVVVVGGLQDFKVSPRPFGFGFEIEGLGVRVWGQRLTISPIKMAGKENYFFHYFRMTECSSVRNSVSK